MCEDTHANQSHSPENNDGKEAVEKFGHSFCVDHFLDTSYWLNFGLQSASFSSSSGQPLIFSNAGPVVAMSEHDFRSLSFSSACNI